MMKTLETGVILRGVGGNYTVDCGGRRYGACRASGRLRLDDRVPMVGDRVELEIDPIDGSGYITAILPRRNGLLRPAIANIDQLFILASQAPPKADPYLIDRLTVLAAWQDIRPVVVLNKGDLDASDQLFETYSAAGIDVLRVSAQTGQGIGALAGRLADKVSAFTGHSGVGKSSLLNRLDGSFDLMVGDMSHRIGRGRNTTRHVELHRLKNGGYVADTPGFSAFDITRMTYIPKERLAGLFPEIAGLNGSCRFADCAHIREPGCAFLALLDEKPQLKSRHESYVRLYGELSQVKTWELTEGKG